MDTRVKRDLGFFSGRLRSYISRNRVWTKPVTIKRSALKTAAEFPRSICNLILKEPINKTRDTAQDSFLKLNLTF